MTIDDFFALEFTDADAAPRRRSFTLQFEQSEFSLGRSARMIFAGPTYTASFFTSFPFWNTTLYS
jgi:hypothetical protein